MAQVPVVFHSDCDVIDAQQITNPPAIDAERMSNDLNISGSTVGTVVYQPMTVINQLQEQQSKSLSSIKRYTQPITNFEETKKFLDVKRIAQCQQKVILHCHGFPGTGKSEIVRKLAQEFPYVDTFPLYVKWHIECDGREHDIKEKLQELVKSMHKHNLLPESTPHQNIIEDLNRNKAGSLVDAMCATKVPVVIILEDVVQSNSALYIDFLRSFNNAEEQDAPFHVYITTRKRKAVLDECRSYTGYRSVSIEGFTEEEAMKYLMNGGRHTEEDKNAAKLVYDRFSGSPLGLKAARSFCKESRISYKDYKEILLEDEQTVHAGETKNLEAEYGHNVQHIFQAITMPFRPKEDNDKQVAHTWKVLSCLSHLHYSSIPRFVVGRFCQYFREDEVKNHRTRNKMQSGQIISKLEDYSMCVVGENDDINFHEVILHAFRVNTLNVIPVDITAGVISGLITKDMRDKEVSEGMVKLIPHIQTLLGHIGSHYDLVQDPLTRLIISHIYEVFGAVGTNQTYVISQDCRDCLGKALNIVYGQIFGEDLTLDQFIDLYQSRKPVADVAELMVRACTEAGAKLEAGFIGKYESKVLLLRPGEELNFLEEKGKNKTLFNKIREFLKVSPVLTTEILEILRECGLFLHEKLHSKIFFAERLTSILQSTSRVILYSNNESSSEHQKYLWLSNLAYHIALRCREKYGVRLLFEHISVVGGSVPITLKWCHILEPSEQTKHLMDAKKTLEDALDTRDVHFDFYEHGILRQSDGIYNQMNINRYLIRIYTKLCTANESDDRVKEEGRKTCCMLYETALANLKWVIAYRCLTYCGKFFSAIKDHDMAVTCFDSFFASANQSHHTLWGWAVYCFAVAVHAANDIERVDRAAKMCKDILQNGNNLNEFLRQNLPAVLKKLQEMI
nr:uncharacterized protein LOC100178506 [Ciona intestinalis]|eukprot:XP_002126104.3 uncharacterized protein LOC100178506 [Ciona intestinalis]